MQQEPIWVREKRYNVLPYRFLHRGVERRVQRVERVWEVGGGRRKRAGHYFRVRCHDNTTYDLFHDVGLNAWFVERRRSIFAIFGRAIRNTASTKERLRWTFT